MHQHRRPVNRPGTARTTSAGSMKFGRINSREIRPNSAKPAAPPLNLVFFYFTHAVLSINITLAGVAQSVERVALITAKRSTSRSWVRAPPSAIPISKLIRAAVLLLFVRLVVPVSTSLSHSLVGSHETPWPTFYAMHTARSSPASCMLFLPDKEESLGGGSLPFAVNCNGHGRPPQ
jgi:hypothetical protein